MSIKNIKVISRNPDHYLRASNYDIHKLPRNYNPELHPLQSAREYKLALNAVKLERVFAKPFIGDLSHTEAVSCLCRHPKMLSSIYSGTCEGELYFWDLTRRYCRWKVQAHNGQVHSICSPPDGDSFFSVGNDKTIKQWSLSKILDSTSDLPNETWLSDSLVTGISHHYANNEFVTCGERVLLWDSHAKAPKATYDWGTSKSKHEATVVSIKFNPVEMNIFAASDHANNVILYDTRSRELKKFKMTLRLNALDWNPMEPMIFTAASEDYNCYSFDIRKMDTNKPILGMHAGHTAAVLDVSYSPTGKEFCTAGYDRSIRIFRNDQKHSRDVYSGKRLFRVQCVLWSGDARYITSGSSDHNVRLWKALSHQKMGIMKQREKSAINYSEELKGKFASFPEIKQISKRRHLPKSIYFATKEHKLIKEKIMRREANDRRHRRYQKIPFKSDVTKAIVGVQDDFSLQASTSESQH